METANTDERRSHEARADRGQNEVTDPETDACAGFEPRGEAWPPGGGSGLGSARRGTGRPAAPFRPGDLPRALGRRHQSDAGILVRAAIPLVAVRRCVFTVRLRGMDRFDDGDRIEGHREDHRDRPGQELAISGLQFADVFVVAAADVDACMEPRLAWLDPDLRDELRVLDAGETRAGEGLHPLAHRVDAGTLQRRLPCQGYGRGSGCARPQSGDEGCNQHDRFFRCVRVAAATKLRGLSMTFNQHLKPALFLGSLLTLAACDFDKSVGDLKDGETGGETCDAPALTCADGSVVTPQPPLCAAPVCPGEGDDTGGECPADAMLCPDGSSVVRQDPDCQFAPCPETCGPESCGPAPGVPSQTCADGSMAGPSCEPAADGTCAWTVRECEDVSCTGDARLCADGSAVGREPPSCEFPACPGECNPDDCDPMPPIYIPIELCEDGSYSGAFCMQAEDGGCGWEIRECVNSCPADGLVCPDGTTVLRTAPNCEFAPCPTSCDEGATYFTPAGCPSPDVPVLPGAGCYAPCTEAGAECASGGTCTVVQTNPCQCAEGMACCAACGEHITLCVPDGAITACSELVQRSFESVEERECGITPDGVSSCHWSVSFTANEYVWRHSDVGETGPYDCEDGRVSAGELVGEFDAEAGRLVWDGVEYRVVE